MAGSVSGVCPSSSCSGTKPERSEARRRGGVSGEREQGNVLLVPNDYCEGFQKWVYGR